MKTIKLSKRQLDNLKRYEVPKEVSNTEGEIYYLKTGIKKIDSQDLLFKKLYVNHDIPFVSDEKYEYIYHSSSMANKFSTISKLNDYKNTINIEELVIPKHQVIFKDEIIGFTVPEIKDARSLQAVLSDIKISSEDKIDCLKQIGETLKKIKHLRLYDINFYIHDLQESNVLVTNKDKKIHFIDLDSATFSTDQALSSKPLVVDKKLNQFSKYKYNKVGVPYPGEEQELYSYIIMILKTLYGGNIQRLSLDEYNEYLAYLSSLDIDYELLRSFSNIYTDMPNINPVDRLDTLDTIQIAQASNIVYQAKKKRKLI